MTEEEAGNFLKGMVKKTGWKREAVGAAVGSKSTLYNWFGGAATGPLRLALAAARANPAAGRYLFAFVGANPDLLRAFSDPELAGLLFEAVEAWNDPQKRDDIRHAIRLGIKASTAPNPGREDRAPPHHTDVAAEA